MPELPEVETLRRDLREHVLGRAFVDVWVSPDAPRLVQGRSPEEFRRGHPKGAVNVPPHRLEAATAGYRRDTEMLVICQSGHRSARAAQHLNALGFTDVVNVRGGLGAWQRAGLPVD